MLSEPLRVVACVAAALQALDVRYAIGGSLASSIHGIPRATQDVDLVAELEERHVPSFVSSLGNDFYVDADAVHAAVRERASFNVIHLPTMFKAGIFIPADDPWAHAELERARVELLESDGAPVRLRFASPEDTLLHKLVWYRAGREISDRQW